MNLLIACALLLQAETAEETFQKIEKALTEAKSVRIRFKATWPFGQVQGKFSGMLLLKEGGKVNLFGKGGYEEQQVEYAITSDGKRLRANGFRTDKTSARWLREWLPTAPTRSGLIILMIIEKVAGEDKTCEVSGWKQGELGKERRTLTYKVQFSEKEACDVTLEYDPKTYKVLKRTLGSFIETYEECDLNADLPDSLFTTQPKSGLTKGLIQQLERSVVLYQLYIGSAPRALGALVKQDKTEGFWPAGGFLPRSVPPDAWGRPFLCENGAIKSLGADGKPGGEGEDQDIVVPLPPPDGRPIRPPTERLKNLYTARIHVQLLAAAAEAYCETYDELPKSLTDLKTKPAMAEIWPEGGFIETLPRDPTGKEYAYEAKGKSFTVKCTGLERLKPDKLTDEEKRGLAEGAALKLTAEEQAEIQKLIEQLGSDDLAARDSAGRELSRKGPRVAGLLDERIGKERDSEVLGRLRDIRGKIRGPEPSWKTELGRLSAGARRKPSGTIGQTEKARCMNHLRQLWTMQHIYMNKFGGRTKRMPEATGTEFWLTLSSPKVRLIDDTYKDILTCPLSGEEEGVCTYWGPKENVMKSGDGDPVGMCDEHGDEAVILIKAGDVTSVKRDDPLYKRALEALKGPEDE